MGEANLNQGNVVTGTVTGTGSAIDVTLGFTPVYVKLLNTSGDAQLEWTEEMPDGDGQKVVDSGAGTTDVSTITTGGITPSADGFQIGTDTDLNVNTEEIRYLAMG